MKKHLLTLAITLALPAFAHADAIQAGNGIAVVQTQSGTVQGYIHRDILTYKGIPYATAARFMPPQKVANWQGEKLALTYGDVGFTAAVSNQAHPTTCTAMTAKTWRAQAMWSWYRSITA